MSIRVGSPGIGMIKIALGLKKENRSGHGKKRAFERSLFGLFRLYSWACLPIPIVQSSKSKGEKNDTQFRWKPLCIIPQNEQFRVTLIFER